MRTSIQVIPVSMASILVLALAPLAIASNPESEDFSQQWWMPKQIRLKEKIRTQSQPSASLVPSDKQNSIKQEPINSELPANQTVPGYFIYQPQVYKRPTEIFRQAIPVGIGEAYAPSGYGCNSTAAGVWPGYGPSMFGGLSGWPASVNTWSRSWSGIGPSYSGWGPSANNWGSSYSGWGPNYSGWGRGANNWGANWSGLGSSWGGMPSNLGSLRNTGNFASGVIQSEPSKASGNYYAPSNLDTTASGSHYATDTPALVPSLPLNSSPNTYWDENSNPIPSNLR